MRRSRAFWFFVVIAVGGLASLHYAAWVIRQDKITEQLETKTETPLVYLDIPGGTPAVVEKLSATSVEVIVKYEAKTPIQRTANRQADLIVYRTEMRALRTQTVYPVKCVGGPANQYTYLLPHRPAELVRTGGACVWVTVAGIYLYDPPIKVDKDKLEKDRPKVLLTIKHPHESKMEISSIGLYMLEEREGQYQLGFIGSANLQTFSEWMILTEPKIAVSKNAEKPTYEFIVPITTAEKATRQQPVYRVQCIGGPVDGGVALLTAEPMKLFMSGCNTVWVSDLSPYPPPDPRVLSFGKKEDKSNTMIGSMCLYTLEEDKSRSYRLRFSGACLPEQYVKKHAPADKKTDAKPKGDKP